MRVQNELINAVVVVVDVDAQVCRMLKRIIERGFEVVLTAMSIEEAEKILAQVGATHLVCDYEIGEDGVNCFEAITNWRNKYASIRRSIVLTGTDISSVPVPDEVDLVLAKTMTPTELLRALGW